ncbi:hypothetical protein BMS3Abin17_00846 [archaeon BMS3Abin17]|nr:hypothetical protein BMS3Abin17_00846 [archaeon BMS3Abin17]HDZ60204.1 hypothetical protein [Candidatus Pacearchaeota archaeon]
MGQSFVDIEERREYLEDLGRRHERFPDELNEVAEKAEEFFYDVKKGLDKVAKGANPNEVSIGYFRSLPECVNLDNIPGYLMEDEFDIHKYMDALYVDKNQGNTYFPAPLRSDLWPAIRDSEQNERQNNSHHGEGFVEESIRRINEKPKHLREFSGRFIDTFGTIFVGNGFRHTSNNLNFLMKGEGMEYENNAFVLSEEDEAKFLASIKSVEYLEFRDIPKISEDAQNWFFTNGWSKQHQAYRLNFDDGRDPLIAYMHNSISGEAYREGELLIANQEGTPVLGSSDRKVTLDSKLMVKDLNELGSGLGDNILRLLDGHNSYGGLNRRIEEINGLLAETGFTPDEIYVDRGGRRTKSLTTVFRDHASAYQFADQFDA